MTHPDTKRLRTLAEHARQDARLLERLAERHHDAIRHIDDELSVLGFPRRGGSSEWVTGGSSDLTSVEQDAHIVWTLTATREDVRDQVAATVGHYRDWRGHLKALGIIIHTASKTGLTTDERGQLTAKADRPAMCCDNQVGKHAADEWGDGTCHRPADKAGLCSKHYWDWYRARLRDGINTSRDHEPAG